MGKTSIQWTAGADGSPGMSWNPLRGCSMAKGSELGGCLNCYAAAQAVRFAGEGGPFHLFARSTKNGPRWTGKVEVVEKHLHDPLHWRKPKKIFVNSMSDLFHESLPFSDILRIHITMLGAEQHTYQVLTKRPEIAKEFYLWWDRTCPGHAYPKDLWVGASIEDQPTADRRIPYIASLSSLPITTFLSYEPALGPVDFTKHFWIGEEGGIDFCYTPRQQIALVIVGGESGHGARTCETSWVRNTIRQCKAAKVACFVKQLGARIGGNAEEFGGFVHCTHQNGSFGLCDSKGGNMSEWPSELRVREFPEVR